MFRKIAILGISIIIGTASTDIFAVGGSVTDTALTTVVCKNMTTKQTVTVKKLKGAASWDCGTKLLTRVGDTIQETVTGIIIDKNVNVLGKIAWRAPWIDDPSYFEYGDFIPKDDGFEIYLLKISDDSYWGIQVISDSFVNLENREYKIQFDIEATNDGAIHFNIQTDDVWDMKQIFSTDIKISVYKNRVRHFSTTFTEDAEVDRLLNFKIGKYLPSKTTLIVKNISITPNN